VDEIDKAPRDLPNDLLNELEGMTFTVKETGRTFRSDPAWRPILVLTSNSEKNLPDAFLRRCVFYHIPFPGPERLRAIVAARLGDQHPFSPAQLDAAMALFSAIRELGLKKQPATAEFLAWIQILSRLGINVSQMRDDQRQALLFSYSLLAKTREDLELLRTRGAEGT
jgi:MoxR-like ATPase